MSSRSSKTEAASEPRPATILVGRVVRPHGVRGEVLVEVWSDLPERLDIGSVLVLAAAGHPPRRVRVERTRSHSGGRVLALSGIGNRDAAESIAGALLEVERERSPDLPAGRYYYWQLLGCRCVDRRSGPLGRVSGLMEDGGGLLLEIEDATGRDILVPFVEAFLARVDVGQELIELDLPEGFVEACASQSSPSSPSSSSPS